MALSSAAHWVLDRNDVLGTVGEALLVADEDDDEDEADPSDDQKDRVIDQREIPNRLIYCIDLRVTESASDYINEIKRIATESTTQVVDLMSWVGGSPKQDQLERFKAPTNDTALGPKPNGQPKSKPVRIDEAAGRRWYPVIDFSKCTNCMECIDFCLFGVYGVDNADTILVEQPDSCRRDAPRAAAFAPETRSSFHNTRLRQLPEQTLAMTV